MAKVTCLFLIIGLFCAVHADAQDYQWHCTLKMPTYCVAFNPLSKGRVLFTSSPESEYIFRSDDGGETWHTSQPLDVPTPDIHQIFCLPSDTNIVFALSSGEFHANAALYRSTDGGMHWTAQPDIGGIDGEAIAYHPSTDELYYGENFAGLVYKSTNHGSTWIPIGTQNSSVTLCSLGVSPDSNKVLLAGSEAGVIDLSTDEGSHWTVVYPEDTVRNPEVPKVIFSNVASNVAFVTRWHSLDASLVMTRDRGFTWSAIASPDPHVWALELDQRKASCPSGTPLHLWTGLFTQNVTDTTAGGLIEESTDGGTSWHTTGFPRIPIPPSVWVLKYDTTSGTLAAATDSGIFIGHAPGSSVKTTASEKTSLELYPNPSRGLITVSIPSMVGNSILHISNTLGVIVFEKNLRNSSTTTLNLTGLSGGVYFVRVISSSGQSWGGHVVRQP